MRPIHGFTAAATEARHLFDDQSETRYLEILVQTSQEPFVILTVMHRCTSDHEQSVTTQMERSAPDSSRLQSGGA